MVQLLINLMCMFLHYFFATFLIQLYTSTENMLLIWLTGMRKVLICLEDWIFVTLCLNIPLFLGFMLVCY
jgi:hypothetical protein